MKQSTGQAPTTSDDLDLLEGLEMLKSTFESGDLDDETLMDRFDELTRYYAFRLCRLVADKPEEAIILELIQWMIGSNKPPADFVSALMNDPPHSDAFR